MRQYCSILGGYLFGLQFRLLFYFLLLPFTAYAGTCGPAGDATLPREMMANVRKNDTAQYPVDPKITIASFLSPGEDSHRFDLGRAASITGYVVKVQPGGIESCNCHARDAANRDTHIFVAIDRYHTWIKDCMVVEVTPRTRLSHPDWTTPILRNRLRGRTVTFVGSIFWDAEHEQNAVNTNPSNRLSWRRTAWELHPVTDIRL